VALCPSYVQTPKDDLPVFPDGEVFVLVTDTIIDIPQLLDDGSSVGDQPPGLLPLVR